jgi:hypothetical protein
MDMDLFYIAYKGENFNNFFESIFGFFVIL